jgi:hypothetical protein
MLSFFPYFLAEGSIHTRLGTASLPGLLSIYQVGPRRRYQKPCLCYQIHKSLTTNVIRIIGPKAGATNRLTLKLRWSQSGSVVLAVATNQSNWSEMTQPHWRKYSPGWSFRPLLAGSLSTHDTETFRHSFCNYPACRIATPDSGISLFAQNDSILQFAVVTMLRRVSELCIRDVPASVFCGLNPHRGRATNSA